MRRPGLAYAAVALVLGAALAVVLLDPRPDAEGPTPPAPPTAPVDAEAPPEPTVLYDVQLPSRRSPNQLEDRYAILALPGDRDLRLAVEYGAAGDGGLTWPAVRLLDPAGNEVERCDSTTDDCDWTVPQPAPGLWRFGVAPDGSWPVHVTASLLRADLVPRGAEVANETRAVGLATRSGGWNEHFLIERDDLPFTLELQADGLPSCGATFNVFAPDGGADQLVLAGQRIEYDPEPGAWRVAVSPGACTSAGVVATLGSP